MVRNTRADSKSTIRDANKMQKILFIDGRWILRNEYRKLRNSMYQSSTVIYTYSGAQKFLIFHVI